MPGKRVLIIDAFTDKAFSGNSAGVVPDADGLTEPQMQAIAREINSAETTFVTRPASNEADIVFRWFTPAREVEFCGHATLAGVHSLIELERIRRGESSLRIATRFRGVVAIRIDAAGVIWIDVPKPIVRPCDFSVDRLAHLIGADLAAIDREMRPVLTTDNDVIVAVRDHESLMSLRPRTSEIRELCVSDDLRGILVTTRRPVDSATVAHSRFFAPAFGVDEDPVTGSVHGPLGAYLVESGVVRLVDGRASFQCGQGHTRGRGGIVRVDVVQNRERGLTVQVGGTCRTTIRGEFAALP